MYVAGETDKAYAILKENLEPICALRVVATYTEHHFMLGLVAARLIKNAKVRRAPSREAGGSGAAYVCAARSALSARGRAPR